MRRIAASLVIPIIVAGCASRHVDGAGSSKLCQGTTFVIAQNSTRRWFDLMYDGSKIATVQPGATIRQAVTGNGRAYFTETPLRPAGNDRSRPTQPQLVCTPPVSQSNR
jgi:hypothetical protein